MSATPRPWISDIRAGLVAVYGGEPRSCLDGISRSQDCVFTIQADWKDGRWNMPDGAEANAELIVRAVNAHDALVEALEGLWSLIDSGWLVRDTSLDHEEGFHKRILDQTAILLKAHNALRLVRGES